jgi:hypothetical protein
VGAWISVLRSFFPLGKAQILSPELSALVSTEG